MTDQKQHNSGAPKFMHCKLFQDLYNFFTDEIIQSIRPAQEHNV